MDTKTSKIDSEAGRRLGRIGGPARARKLSPADRRRIAIRAIMRRHYPELTDEELEYAVEERFRQLSTEKPLKSGKETETFSEPIP